MFANNSKCGYFEMLQIGALNKFITKNISMQHKRFSEKKL